MAPLIKAFEQAPTEEVVICVTGQHREMLDQVLEFFDIKPHYDLKLMTRNQTLFDVTAKALTGIAEVLTKETPDNIFVQGDTTTAMVGALAGFYNKIKVSHIEAGLRSHNLYSPFPEEGNRLVVGRLTNYHFPPTPKAAGHLQSENIQDHIYTVGNTVIDALFLGLDIIKQKGEDTFFEHFAGIDFNKRVILVTGHRRESFGQPFENICRAIKDLSEQHPDVEVVYPVHLNPNVRQVVNKILHDLPNVYLIEPLSYPYLIWLMNKSYLVLTDSGGIQEEAPSLGKPVLVMREVTERTEGVEARTALLVGTDYDKIMFEANRLLNSQADYEAMAKAVNPYGDGTTSQQVLKIFQDTLS